MCTCAFMPKTFLFRKNILSSSHCHEAQLKVLEEETNCVLIFAFPSKRRQNDVIRVFSNRSFETKYQFESTWDVEDDVWRSESGSNSGSVTQLSSLPSAHEESSSSALSSQFLSCLFTDARRTKQTFPVSSLQTGVI
jgi:hypothetical protein